MASLNNQLLSGAFYNALAKYSGIVISLVVSGILARLLTPEDFGVVTIATVIITFFAMFSNMGFSAAIIQRRDLSTDDLSSLFSITIWFGALLALLFFFIAPLIADFYGREELTTICRILCIQLFFSTANIVPNSLFFRDKRFRFLAMRTVSIQITTGILAVGAALYGWGFYALLVNPLLSIILIFAISFRTYPLRLQLKPGIGIIRKIFSYSAYQFLFNFVNYFSNNLDKVFIGKYIGMQTLGYYEKSYRLMELPLQNITHVISPVMHPVLSEFQNDMVKLESSYRKIVHFLSLIGFPLGVVLLFTARELILLIFGQQWLPSVAVFQIMSLMVGVRVVLSSSGAIFQAANDTRSLFIAGSLSSAINILGVLAGIFFFGTVEAVAAILCFTHLLNFVQCYYLMYRVTLRLPVANFIRQFLSPLLCTAILGAVLWPLSWWLTIILGDQGMLISLSTKFAISAAVFTAYIHFSGEINIVQTLRQRRIVIGRE